MQGVGSLGESFALLRADDGDASGRRLLPEATIDLPSPLTWRFLLGVQTLAF
jgi:hypothetical protein